MTKRILIHAYTQLNLGDDLFIKILCERYKDTKFYIMSNVKFFNGLKNIPNLTIYPRIPYIDRILKKFDISINEILQNIFSKYCNGVVNIGGSIFIQDKEWKRKVKQYNKRIKNNKSFYIIGSNFGPFSDKSFYDEYKMAFSKVKDICFRERYSFDLFRELKNIRYASDVVFSINTDVFTNNKNKEDKEIVISVIDLSNRDNLKHKINDYESYIFKLCKRFIEEGYSICLMGFCKDEGDEKAIDRILDKFNYRENNKIRKYIYSGNLDESLNIIYNSTSVIASRFHAMILGWVFEKTVYPITYSKKSTNVIKDVKFDGLYTDIHSIDESTIDSVVNYLTSGKVINIDKQIESANIQFELLDQLLNNKIDSI